MTELSQADQDLLNFVNSPSFDDDWEAMQAGAFRVQDIDFLNIDQAKAVSKAILNGQDGPIAITRINRQRAAFSVIRVVVLTTIVALTIGAGAGVVASQYWMKRSDGWELLSNKVIQAEAYNLYTTKMSGKEFHLLPLDERVEVVIGHIDAAIPEPEGRDVIVKHLGDN